MAATTSTRKKATAQGDGAKKTPRSRGGARKKDTMPKAEQTADGASKTGAAVQEPSAAVNQPNAAGDGQASAKTGADNEDTIRATDANDPEGASARQAEANFADAQKAKSGHGIVIVQRDDQRVAIVPRNAARYLNAVTKANKQPNPNEWADLSRVYEVSKEIPEKAFPGKDSAKTLAQSVKKNLANHNVIEIKRAGHPGQGAVIRILVDSWEQKAGHQGVAASATKTKARATRTPGARGGARGGARPNAGRPSNATLAARAKAAAAATAAAAGNHTNGARAPKGGTVTGLNFRNVAEMVKFMAEIEAIRKEHPVLYERLIKPQLGYAA